MDGEKEKMKIFNLHWTMMQLALLAIKIDQPLLIIKKSSPTLHLEKQQEE